MSSTTKMIWPKDCFSKNIEEICFLRLKGITTAKNEIKYAKTSIALSPTDSAEWRKAQFNQRWLIMVELREGERLGKDVYVLFITIFKKEA